MVPTTDYGCTDYGLLLRLLLGQHALGRREARDRDTVGRAADIVQAGAVAELNRLGVAAVLAADADLEVAAGGAAALRADLHQLAHALLVERHEGVVGEDPALDVARQEL